MTLPPLLPHIDRMTGYLPGEQPRDGAYVKLNTNENPYPPSPRVLESLHAAIGADLRRYPDAGATGVRRRLADRFGLPAEQFVVGNGSDELLNVVVRCFVGPGDSVAFATPTYPYYQKLIDLQGARAVTVEFDDDFGPPEALADTGARLIFLPNPNSPSGTAVPVDFLERLATATDALVVIDEAYVDFARVGAVELVERHANIAVMRTLSKSFSLAGLRIGFCLAAPAVIAAMWKVKEHYNVNALSLAAAAAALDDLEWMQANARAVIATRDRLTRGLRDLGLHVWDSEANFVLLRTPAPETAGALYAGLRERGILVRYFGDNRRLADCLRISVGTDDEIDRLLRDLAALL